MDYDAVKNCMKSLKSKNLEFDRIPKKILVHGVDILAQPMHKAKPMHKLMTLVYSEKRVPEQWLVSKTIPDYKNKGQTKDIKNYRPISNLCLLSKVFKK